MKKLLLLLCAAVISVASFAQDFEFTKVIQAKGTASELFSKSKDFVSQTYNSAKDVIQNEDEKANILLLKAKYMKKYGAGMGLTCEYIYEYSVKIQCRDGRSKIDIFDVACIDAQQAGLGTVYSIPKIQPFEGDDTEQKTKIMGRGISKKKAVQMMQELKEDFNNLITAYGLKLQEQEEEW